MNNSKKQILINISIGILAFIITGLLIVVYKQNNKINKLTQPKQQQHSNESSNKIGCTRDERYNMPPEFDRALSLIDQRIVVNVARVYENCIDIQYAKNDNEIGGAEGVFLFDPTNSNIDRLVIKVSPRYKNQSDLLTAFLLSHETMHAFRYATAVQGNNNLDPSSTSYCYEDEALAFTNQILFLMGLNEGERETINSIITSNDEFFTNSQEVDVLTDVILSVNESNSCSIEDYGDFMECFKTIFLEKVKLNPYYVKQCEG